MSRKARRRAVLATAFACVLLAAAASAAPAWITPAIDVSNNPALNFDHPGIAVSPNGDVTVIFQTGASLKAVSRPAGGNFSAADTLTGSISPGSRTGVAMDAAGNAYATWMDTTGGGQRVDVAFKPAGGSWSITTLESTNLPDEPNIAMTPSGDAVAVWRTNGGAGLRMARRPAGGAWGSPFPVYSTGAIAEQPQIDINSHGDIALGFRRRTGGGSFFAVAVFEPASSVALSTSVFEAGSAGDDDDPVPAIGLDDSGNASILFEHGGKIKVSNRQAGSDAWSSIAGTNGDVETAASSGAPRMAWNDAGQQVAAWNTGSAATLVAATRTGLGSFTPQTIGPAAGGAYTNGEVGVDANGVGIAVFSHGGSLQSFRSSGASWSAQNTIISTGNPFSALVGADAQGNAATAFINTLGGGTTAIKVAGFDGAGPRLNDLVLPTSAVRGTPFAFSVTPFDVWSSVASTGWTFGEGSSFNGASGNFAYGKAGSFTATVTSTDASGNSSSASRTVTVPSTGGGGGGGGDGGGGGSDTTAPKITGAKLTNVAFAVDAKGKAASRIAKVRKPKRGTTFRYSLSEAARVTFTIQAKQSGRKVGRRCAKPMRANRGKRACVRLVKVGAFAQQGAAGKNAKRFSGKLGRRSLRPGSYVAVLRARDAAGNRSKAVRLSFRVVRG